MSAISGQLAGIYHAASQDDLVDPGVSFNRLGGILAKQQQVGSFTDLDSPNVPIQTQRTCV
ncbi:MAG: hypothetical protein JWO04_5301 [Gammaproteobacteria bacterium]|nr:hypothetical protein [Gammaproteobacteria bacterium]